MVISFSTVAAVDIDTAAKKALNLNGKCYMAFIPANSDGYNPSGRMIWPVYLVIGQSGNSIWGQMVVPDHMNGPDGATFSLRHGTVSEGSLKGKKINFKLLLTTLPEQVSGKVINGGKKLKLNLLGDDGKKRAYTFQQCNIKDETSGIYLGDLDGEPSLAGGSTNGFFGSVIVGIHDHENGSATVVTTGRASGTNFGSSKFENVDVSRSGSVRDFSGSNTSGGMFDCTVKGNKISGESSIVGATDRGLNGGLFRRGTGAKPKVLKLVSSGFLADDTFLVGFQTKNVNLGVFITATVGKNRVPLKLYQVTGIATPAELVSVHIRGIKKSDKNVKLTITNKNRKKVSKVVNIK